MARLSRASDAMLTFEAAVKLLAPNERIYIAGSGGEPPGLVDAITRIGPPLDITTSFVPGINVLPLDRFCAGTTFASMFAHAIAGGAQARGAFRHIPLSYGAFVRHCRTRLDLDTCFVHVSPRGPDGRHSLGPAAEFTMLAAARARRVIAFVNPQLPHMPLSPSFARDEFDATVAIDAPLNEYDVGAPSDGATRIARNIEPFIQDGATLQVGLGKVPDALMRLIADRKKLRLFSGLLSDGARQLHEAGSLDPSFRHTATAYLGPQSLYGWLAGRDDFAALGCEETHALARLMQLPRFVAVNSAISVDLFGQANLEMLDHRMMSGVGGASEFARAAAQSADGLSICALPSTAGKNGPSRVTATIGPLVAIPRHDIDVIVTEHGAADLRGLDVAGRANAIVQIAAPQHRGALSDAANDIIAKL